MTVVDVIKRLCKEKKITIAELERRIELSNGQIRKWSNQTPGIDKVQKVADYFNVSVDYLLGRTEQKNKDITKDAEGFTEKDKKDIGKRMEEIRKDLTDSDGLMFSGEPLTEEALDSLMDAMEYIVKHTQKINKKYIPKKYRNESE
ncbi:helix-turn-helix transcriptional regulator [Bacillus sp. 17RED48]|uniref:helix-turn-helix domain-containing protein n=1 Tax=Bacillus sp. 17RED48 TaxID=2778093 RepID=UPI001C9ABFDE|nr:helix-turn-helix transcriptional regulator [Bacillus sp. 17RED48]MBY7115164.1 helix-turn-helix transcriptional regulator [Bacillus sp. 17RED48]